MRLATGMGAQIMSEGPLLAQQEICGKGRQRFVAIIIRKGSSIVGVVVIGFLDNLRNRACKMDDRYYLQGT